MQMTLDSQKAAHIGMHRIHTANLFEILQDDNNYHKFFLYNIEQKMILD